MAADYKASNAAQIIPALQQIQYKQVPSSEVEVLEKHDFAALLDTESTRAAASKTVD